MPITPYLYYEDVAAARRFLARAFGFRNYGPTNRNKAGTLIHAAMQSGKHVVMMGHPGSKYRSPRRLGEATQCLLVDVSDVEQLFHRAVKAGANIIDDLKETPFGQRRFGAEDLEGHQWYFAESVRRRANGKRRSKAART